ncbi:peptidase M22, glycoprotease [Mycobacteroides abscessus subsp. bolletii]|uniref:Universal bacterial protein YeaZ n=1 Tax=Mycobacteroides abscessus subsp. bolletii TaxID=319705 RepID=A0A9Q7SBG2_9MYCO|nr:tRNA (adenosine(37)-N6)-threonylcarbamoyltransferase complex dimerization subunit type 1 TsaB [Mycobacteroides abscessus]MDO3068812.1 tRNA (adenosine(37)-N6)-threonylcarbamoyltransferase complex dimerization subunit type 1 TsaB [Mycobacteroides abscessus subsp. bolletii]MDO3129303.1 tRNA (adenosine(37)-N6)-threonylcarbamoyltransferase complex dimerization subunit type 1 TsaB [Mycobacteroides abscessus subsp. bolletii]MDO3335378.1 tRNA (adenosine(37)-N6)-threonylcarbamoyltransferase complex di
MTLILALDTATAAITAGLVRRAPDGSVQPLAERITMGAKGHAEALTPNIGVACADAGVAVGDLGAIVVGCGPGPFTGLRVGMATAAAMGLALDIPVYPVCTLDAIGHGTVGRVLVVTDARRREVYWAGYSDGVRVSGPAVDAPADVSLDGYTQVAGSPDHTTLFDLPAVDRRYPSPSRLVQVAGWDEPPGALTPLYLRRPDAKEPRR